MSKDQKSFTVMALRWLDTSPQQRYELFCEGAFTLSQVESNPIVKAYGAIEGGEVNVLGRLGFKKVGTYLGKDNETTQSEIWQKFVQLDFSIDRP